MLGQHFLKYHGERSQASNVETSYRRGKNKVNKREGGREGGRGREEEREGKVGREKGGKGREVER